MRRIQFANRRDGSSRAAHALGVRNFGRRANHAFGDHCHGHGRAADDIHRRAIGRRGLADGQHVAADITANESLDALERNADQHDRFVMRHQTRAGDLSIRRQAFEDLDRLARIAGRVDPIRIDESVAEQLVAREDFCDRRTTLHRSIMIRAGHDVRGGNLTDKLLKLTVQRQARDGSRQPQQHAQSRFEEPCDRQHGPFHLSMPHTRQGALARRVRARPCSTSRGMNEGRALQARASGFAGYLRVAR